MAPSFLLDRPENRPIVLAMDEEPNRSKSLSMGLNLIGLAASLAAILATGGLSIFAGVIAVAFLAGSVAVSLIPAESPCERYYRECDEAAANASVEPAVSPELEAGQSHHWRQSVAASRCDGRRR